jgi:hypothetical protein
MTVVAPTAALIIRDLDRRQLLREMDVLGGLDDVASDAVRHALSAVPRSAKIDVRLLVDSVRRNVAEGAERKAQSEPDPLGILRYRLTLASSDQLESLRDDLRTEREPSVALETIMARLDRIADRLAIPNAVDEPDEEPDDEPPRRSIPRIRSRRAAQESSAPAPAKRRERSIFIGPRLLGPGADDRPYGMSVDYNPRAWCPDPPWLLPDESDEEKADVAIETRADAY